MISTKKLWTDLSPDRLVRSHIDQFNISTITVTCDACRIRKFDVTR